ncbi:hypothetical protein [Bosea sp. PAMC 26642]|uniref:hypothetical protein n=1 Tax=Bosea sp. (strain PAMC 26642) TaxID=1792307 RepID=UPI0012E77044|nr:hypothetical protein [Bosea sp. PAMC 26642]
MVDLEVRVRNPSVTDAIIRFYRDWWLARCGTIVGFLDSLFVIEFRAAGYDINELFEAFVDANEKLERQAYRLGHQRHYGIGYLARSPIRETGLIRALVMVEPQAVDSFVRESTALFERRSGLTVAKCDIDPGDPDAQWRWLANGVRASIAMFENVEPMFVVLGQNSSRGGKGKDTSAARALKDVCVGG